MAKANEILQSWPEESREAAQLVVDTYGDPHEVTESQFTWHRVGPWKRVVASKVFYEHRFPTKHIDAVESVIDYRVPPEKFTALAEFDGSVIVERTAGEVSARCHDEQANFLALNLMHDIVSGTKTVDEAREYYAKEFLDHRRKKATPYMDGLLFATGDDSRSQDPDTPMFSDDELKRAKEEGKQAA